MQFNQDTIRNNFSALTLFVDSLFDGNGCAGGATLNPLIDAKHLLSDALKKAVSADLMNDSVTRSKQ